MHALHQNMRFLYRNGFILESCHICMDSLIISLHGNVNNTKFIKKNIPLNFDQHPPLKPLTISVLYFPGTWHQVTLNSRSPSHLDAAAPPFARSSARPVGQCGKRWGMNMCLLHPPSYGRTSPTTISRSGIFQTALDQSMASTSSSRCPRMPARSSSTTRALIVSR